MVQTRRSSSHSDLASLGKDTVEISALAKSTTTSKPTSKPPRGSSNTYVSSRPPRSRPRETIADAPANSHRQVAAKPPPPSTTLPARSNSEQPAAAAAPREHTGSHFLKGINFDDCQDLLALPSPPPVSNNNGKKRRQSTSFLPKKTTPLLDLTNHGGGGGGDDSSTMASNEKRRSSSNNNKKRRSLCHVPSPMDYHHTNNIGIIQEPPQRKQSPERTQLVAAVEASPPQQQQLTLDLGESDNDGDGGHPSQKARKRGLRRRQSILLPSESGMEELTNVNNGAPTYRMGEPEGGTATVQLITPASGSIANSIATAGASNTSLAELQKIVRAYCLLPDDSRSQSESIHLIRAKTGYSMKLEAPIEESPSNSEDMVRSQQRRALLARIGPAVERMEHQKRATASLAEQATGCTVEKTRNGKYRYRNATGSKVPSDEYKARYLPMIHANRLEKANEYQVLRAHLESLQHNHVEDNQIQEASLLQSNSGKEEDYSGDDGEVEMDPTQLEKSSKCDDDLACCDDKDTINAVSIFEKGESHIVPSSNPLQQDTVVANEALEVMEDSIETSQGKATDRFEPEQEDSTLPLPSREEESDDPEIAQAESKLWLAIDTALEEYSQDVLTIQARKRARTESYEAS